MIVDGVTEGGFYLHSLKARGVAVEAHSKCEGFVVQELMEAFHCSGSAAFCFHRHDQTIAFQHEVDLAGASVFPPPVEKLPASGGLANGDAELLRNALFAESAAQGGGHIRPAREGISCWCIPDSMSQPHIEEHHFLQALIDFPGQRHSVALRVGNPLGELRHAEQFEGSPGLLVLHLAAHMAVDELASQLVDHSPQDIV